MDRLQEALTVNPHDLLLEAARQAEHYAYYAGLAASAEADHDELEVRLQDRADKLTAMWRQTLPPKLRDSKWVVESKLSRDHEYRKIRKELLEAKRSYRFAKVLADAWRQRGDLIKSMQYYAGGEEDQMQAAVRSARRQSAKAIERRSQSSGKTT